MDANQFAILHTYAVYKVQFGIVMARLYIYVFSDIVVFLIGVFEGYVDDLGGVSFLAGYETEVGTDFVQMNAVKLVVEGVDETL